jgi:hypothetical protein
MSALNRHGDVAPQSRRGALLADESANQTMLATTCSSYLVPGWVAGGNRALTGNGSYRTVRGLNQTQTPSAKLRHQTDSL